MSQLGKRLKSLRVARHLSVAEVAERLGVSQSTYRDWEYGRSIMGEPYGKIAKVFNVSLREVMTGEPESIEKELRQIEELVKIIRQKL